MKKNNKEGIVKKYPIIIGFGCILMLMMFIVLYQYWESRHTNASTVIPEELGREANVERLTEVKDITKYMLSAAEQNDLDMAMRGCPIDEMGLHIDTAKIIEQAGGFSNKLIIPPSAKYEEYFPIVSAELAGGYVEQFELYRKNYSKLSNASIKSIDYARPKVQLTSEHKFKAQNLCDIWGADNICEVAVLLESEGKLYVTGFTLARYDHYWKLFSYSSNTAGTSAENLIQSISQEEYEKIVEEDYINLLERELNKDDGKKRRKDTPKETANIKELIDKGEALLPPNYFVVNSAYGATPQRTIEEFSTYIQKQDVTAMLNYGYPSKPENTVEQIAPNLLLSQRDFAVQVKTIYFNILRDENGEQKKTLEELGETAGGIVSSINPETMFYMDLMHVVENDDSRYTAIYWYGGKKYAICYQLIKVEAGWKIKDIESVEGITDREYKQLLMDDKKQ